MSRMTIIPIIGLIRIFFICRGVYDFETVKFPDSLRNEPGARGWEKDDWDRAYC